MWSFVLQNSICAGLLHQVKFLYYSCSCKNTILYGHIVSWHSTSPFDNCTRDFIPRGAAIKLCDVGMALISSSPHYIGMREFNTNVEYLYHFFKELKFDVCEPLNMSTWTDEYNMVTGVACRLFLDVFQRVERSYENNIVHSFQGLLHYGAIAHHSTFVRLRGRDSLLLTQIPTPFTIYVCDVLLNWVRHEIVLDKFPVRDSSILQLQV